MTPRASASSASTDPAGPKKTIRSPAPYGIVGQDSIAYPFNEACGTAQQYDSYVEAWIYDTAGDRSTPVIIHLVCT